MYVRGDAGRYKGADRKPSPATRPATTTPAQTYSVVFRTGDRVVIKATGERTDVLRIEVKKTGHGSLGHAGYGRMPAKTSSIRIVYVRDTSPRGGGKPIPVNGDTLMLLGE